MLATASGEIIAIIKASFLQYRASESTRDVVFGELAASICMANHHKLTSWRQEIPLAGGRHDVLLR